MKRFNDTVGREKNIYVQYLTQSEMERKALVATAGGVPPDIAGVWDGQLPAWAAMGALEPLDEMAKERGITKDYYKRVCWESCVYEGHLYALISTPGGTGLVWNKKVFQEAANELRAAGCDPDRPPATLDELDRYAKAIDKWDIVGGRKQLVRTGYHPMEPGWYLPDTPLWFGGEQFDPVTQKLTLTTPECVKAFEWIASFSKRLGVDAASDFKAGMGGFASPQNPFIVGQVAMVQQGPWMPNYFDRVAPWMNHWKIQGEAEKNMTIQQRRDNCAWGAAPFPASDPKRKNVCIVGVDILCIPKTSKHKKEAFEFIAFVNRQDISEKLNSMQCKPSPLARVSENFIKNHPNPYIEVFETLLRSENAYSHPSIPIATQVSDELVVASQRIFRHEMTATEALEVAQSRMQMKWDEFRRMRKIHEEAN
jgi:multiple sugar transport system substrate-binding protein